MNKLFSIMLAVVGLCCFGFDESTLAFYSFNDGGVGTSASSSSLTNSVDGSCCTGTAYGTVQFSDEFPGSYILSNASDGETLAVSPQSLWIDGGSVEFDGIMDALSAEDEYTIEFFWKKPTSIAATDTSKTSAIGFNIGQGYDLNVNIPGDAATDVQMWIQVERKVTMDQAVQDGEWHHTAIAFQNNTFFLTVDYVRQGVRGNYVGHPITLNHDASGALRLSPDSSFRGFVCCVRVTKKYLSDSQMMRASNSPIYDPGTDPDIVDAETPKARTTSMNNWWMTRHETVLSTIQTSGSTIKTVFLGDSITELWDAAIWNDAFSSYGPLNLGYTADTTGHVLWRIENGELDGYTAEKVVLLIGTNNLGTEPVRQTVRGIRAVLNAVRAKQPGAQVLLHALFPRDDHDAEFSRKLRLVNEGIRQLADGRTVLWCDYHDKFLLQDGTLNDALYKADKLHPVASGYAVWRDNLLPDLDPEKFGPIAYGAVFDSETVAFYPFDDVANGASFVGTTIRNAAAPTKFGGAANVMEASGYANVAGCSASLDRPGRYIFVGAGTNGLPFVTNPRSLYIKGKSNSPGSAVQAGAQVVFADLASEILSNVDYTVEFFFKIPTGADSFNWFDYNFTWGDGTTAAGLQLTRHDSGSKTMQSVWFSNGGQAANICSFSYPEKLKDGNWHHIAAVNRGGKPSLYLDYVNYVAKDGAVAAKTTENRPFVLGDTYRWQGYVSCLRVMKRALGPAELLHASDNPDFASDTVFHWSLEGTPGAQTTIVTNVAEDTSLDFDGQYITRYISGHGEVIDNGLPVEYSSSAYRRGKTVVSGGEKMHVNLSSGSLPYVSGTGFTSLKLPATPVMPIGSFTFETFFQFVDRASWEQHKDHSTYCVLARKPSSLSSNANGYDWWCGIWAYSSGCVVNKVVTETGENIENYVATGKPFDGKWHHYAFVYDESKLTIAIYLDYDKMCEKTLPARIGRSLNASDDMVYVGAGAGILSSFEGYLDEVRFSRRALTPDEFIRVKSFDGVMIYIK